MPTDAHRNLRIDLAAAFRIAAHLDWHESVANHFSVAVPGEDRFGCLRVPAFRSYAAWMSSSEWQRAIADALGRDNPCFMCAETLPWRCHRRLIADLLVAREVDVVHLLGPGATLEQRPFAEAEVRNGRLYLCGTLVA